MLLPSRREGVSFPTYKWAKSNTKPDKPLVTAMRKTSTDQFQRRSSEGFQQTTEEFGEEIGDDRQQQEREKRESQIHQAQ